MIVLFEQVLLEAAFEHEDIQNIVFLLNNLMAQTLARQI